MKFEYVKPELEEIKLVLEGSFLDGATGSSTDPSHPDVSIDPGDNEGDDWN
ncbi:MAG: hypothetical protein K2L81_03865 [Muribaculaceae bacterium]|nr:hypothetical protein [Muribaculaceae bacterium]